ncbi:MAG TPA: site-specific DNA-methyltransferase [Solirubrobacteraceae bacterium]|jgi:adenine-specific DNA-methyltransferase
MAQQNGHHGHRQNGHSQNGRQRNKQRHRGRLELTWTNKDEALLAHEDGSYEWVPRSDYRVAEVRLLDEHGAVGEVAGTTADNLLIRGDALNALTSLSRLSPFAEEYAGKVKLAYLDPPFNTQQSFLQYDDALEHSVWLTMMRDRLAQVKDLLSLEGSVWVHCDDSEQAHLRVLMDELFGREQFIATIVWQKRYSRDNRPAIGTVHDYILVYAPMGGEWKRVRNRIPREAAKEYRNPNNDPQGPWRPIPMDAQGYRPNQMYEIVAPSGKVWVPPKGRCWSMVQERYVELLADGPVDLPSRMGRIYFGKDGNGRPNVIRYLHEDEGLVPWTWWPSSEVGHNDEAKKEQLELSPDIEAFDTPKPERLMSRIIQIATDPGDIVLDPFVGSGTTAAVAHKMDRRWIAGERSLATVETYARPRLGKVVAGDDPGGVTEKVGWMGGGGFRVLDVAPSMFEDAGGVVLLAEWATNGQLSAATAAQLGFQHQLDPPFSGHKGHQRLAVIDGLVNRGVIELLVRSVGEGESIVVCGTAVADDAGEHLRQALPGSRVRKIPASLLAEYRLASKPTPDQLGHRG